MKRTNQKRVTITVYTALAIITFLAFYKVIQSQFITTFDDDLYVTQNRYVNTGLSRDNITWAFTRTHAYNWHPVTWISHMVDCELFGLNPAGHHLTNLLLHIINGLLLLTVLHRMTKNLWAGAFVSALFLLHPLHVESVAWISERKDVLSTLFWMLTMLAYLRYTKKPSLHSYILILLAFTFGLMAKQMLVTLPFVLLLVDYWPLRRLKLDSRKSLLLSFRRCFLEKLPLFALSFAAAALVYLVQQHMGVMKTLTQVPLSCRVRNAVVSYAVYIYKTVWPTKLAVFYPFRCDNLGVLKVGLSILLIIFVTVLVLFQFRRKGFLAVGWLWYLGTLVPVIGLVQVGNQAMADRYSYIPSTGLFIMIGFWAAELAKQGPAAKRAVFAAASAVILVLAVLTWRQAGFWKDDVALHRHATEVVEQNWWAEDQLGISLGLTGKLDESALHLRRAISICPDYARAHYNLAVVLSHKGEDKQAIYHLTEAVRIKPDHFKAQVKLANMLLEQGMPEQAIEQFTKAIELSPRQAELHHDLGLALGQADRPEEAMEQFQTALKYKPDYAQAHHNLAVAMEKTGNFAGAAEHFKKALDIEPGRSSSQAGLHRVLKKLKESSAQKQK